jgi:hypothetical protein
MQARGGGEIAHAVFDRAALGVGGAVVDAADAAFGSLGGDRPKALREVLLGWILRAWQPRGSGDDGTPREVAPDTGH